MAVLQDININVYAQPSEKRLRSFLVLSQNENGRSINFRILGAPLPSNCSAMFYGTKPDGTVYSTTGTVAGNFVVVSEDIQMTAVAGVWDAKLDIMHGSHNIVTAVIRVAIEGDVVAPDAVPSDSQITGYVAQAKFYAEQSRIEAYGSPLTATLAADMLDRDRVYVYTGTESGMVQGNWYYWNGTAWTSGGVYNSAAVDTDTTISMPGKAADAAAVGAELSSLKEDLTSVEDALQYITVTDWNDFRESTSTSNVQKNGYSYGIDVPNAPYNRANKALTFAGVYIGTHDAGVQILTDIYNGNKHTIFRREFVKVGGVTPTWSDWKDVSGLQYEGVSDWNDFWPDDATTSVQKNGWSHGLDVPNAPYANNKQITFVGQVVGTKWSGIQLATASYNSDNHVYMRKYIVNSNTITWDKWKAIDNGAFPFEDYIYQSTTSADRLALPVLYLDGDISEMSKDNKVTLNYRFNDRRGTCKCKWQGSSSLAYPKKNYTVTFDRPFEAKIGWGRHDKYVLKSEYFDSTHTRNTVSAKLWGQIVKNRELANGVSTLMDESDVNITTESGNTIDINSSKLLGSPHFGCLDGFHVMVVINNEYTGLYTFGIPKDDWMFGMDNGDANCCVLNAEAYGNNSVRFRATTTEEAIEAEESFAIEYASDDMTLTRITNSINTAITAIINASGSGYRTSIEDYIDVDCAIDYLIFSLLTCNWDGIFHNYNLCTYDGTRWSISAYDLDNTFGIQDLLNYDVNKTYDAPNEISPKLPMTSSENRLFYLVSQYDTARFKARYTELRGGIMSEYNVMTMFYNHMTNVAKEVIAEEIRLWPKTIRSGALSLDAIPIYYRLRCLYLDAVVNAL